MYGWRSSHWPSKACAPPTPSGPTMSGGLPDASRVANASRAPLYATWSRTSLMFGCEALNALMTLSNVLSWSSPPPRQQNHLIWTGPPGGTVAGTLGASDAAAEADADATAAVDADGLGEVVPPPQAASMSDMTASRTASRARVLCTRLLLQGCDGGAGRRSVRRMRF